MSDQKLSLSAHVAAVDICNRFATHYIDVHCEAGPWGTKHLDDVTAIVELAIDAATAEKDKEIERLKAEVTQLTEAVQRMEQWKRCAVGTMDEADETEVKLEQRIEAMVAILDKVEHIDSGLSWPCKRPDCPACAWEKMKAEQMTP